MRGEINRSQEDQYCVVPLTQGSQRRQIRRQDVDSGCQGLAGRGWGMAPYCVPRTGFQTCDTKGSEDGWWG